MVQGKGRLKVYHQNPLAVLKAADIWSANMSRVYDVREGPEEIAEAYLEWLQDAFRCYTPYDPEVPRMEETLIFVFVNQAAPDIRNKFQMFDRLGEKSIRDLMIGAERFFLYKGNC